MAHRKPHLLTKLCPGCGRPFVWRRKWARVWAEVVWCSDRCRRSRGRTEAAGDGDEGEAKAKAGPR